MSKERDLLARAGLVIAQYRWSNPAKYTALHKLSQTINEYLEENPQDEPAPHPFIRLTREEIGKLADSVLSSDWTDEFELYHFARDIEDALVEKNK